MATRRKAEEKSNMKTERNPETSSANLMTGKEIRKVESLETDTEKVTKEVGERKATHGRPKPMRKYQEKRQ